jgi:hypothetical protein
MSGYLVDDGILAIEPAAFIVILGINTLATLNALYLVSLRLAFHSMAH